MTAPAPMPRHHLVVSLFWSGAWHDLSEPDVVDGSASVLRGLTDDGTGRPGEVKFRIHDDAQRFDPDNELSDLYGLIGTRTPVRITTDGIVDMVGEVSGWQPGRTPDYQPGPPQRGWQWTDVTAAGVLRRVGAWPKALDSAARRYFSAAPGIRSYWPFEETSAATMAASGLPFGPPALYPTDGIAPGSVDGPGGSLQAPAVESAPGSWGARYTPIPSGVWQCVTGWRIPSDVSPAAPAGQWMWRIYTSNGFILELASLSATQWQLTTWAGTVSDVAVVNWAPAFVSTPTWWMQWSLRVTPGTNTEVIVQMTDYDGGTGVPGAGGGSVGTTRTLTGWNLGYPVRWEGPNWPGLQWCHHALFDAGGPGGGMTGAEVMGALHGWIGENPYGRVQRLAAESGIACVVVAEDPDETVRNDNTLYMGPQRPDTLINLLREAETTGAGILAEDPASAALWFRTCRSMYADPVLQLVYPRDIVAPFVKTTDDVDFANTVTAKQREGSEVTATLTSGPVGTAAIGAEKRDVLVNMENTVLLPQVAAYWLNMWSGPGARYPSIVIDAELLPALAAAAARLVPGDLITVSGFRPQVVWLQVLSVASAVSTARRTITVTTLPAAQIGRVGVYDRPGDRYDAVSAVAVAAAATGPITVEGDVFNTWSTTAVPYDWSVRGERVTVTAITAPVLTAGRYRQTATVARSVNGAVRAHPAGTAVGLYDPCYWGR